MQIKQPMHQHMSFDMAIVNMDTLQKGEEATVFDVPDIRLLSSLGIRIGKKVKLLTKSFAKGPLILFVNDRSIVIDRSIAQKIIVKR